jgi:HK97 family phage prohead protease
MNEEIEKRAVTVRAMEPDGGGRQLQGYAAMYGVLSEDLGGFREQVAPGAFLNVGTADVRALFDHSSAYVLGRTTAGTLRLLDDARGLAVEVDLPETSWARDVWESVKRGDINQMSFGFRTLKDSWVGNLRTLLAVELLEVSLVAFPAYPQTTAAVRAMVAKNGEQALSGPESAEKERTAEQQALTARPAHLRAKAQILRVR